MFATVTLSRGETIIVGVILHFERWNKQYSVETSVSKEKEQHSCGFCSKN